MTSASRSQKAAKPINTHAVADLAMNDGTGLMKPCAPPPATSLLDLHVSMLADIVSRVTQLGAGNELSLACKAFSLANLLHAPAFRIQLDRQRCYQQLTPRVVSTLQARSRKLALNLEQPLGQDSEQHTDLLAHTLDKLGRCGAVEACKLGSNVDLDLSPLRPLECSPDLAEQLLGSFPGLSALSLHGYAVTCSGLASLLSHPQLALQLEQLDITNTLILEPEHPTPAVTLANLFDGSRLKQLSLDADWQSLLPNLQPLAQHLTQLHIGQWHQSQSALTSAVGALPQLEVLTAHCRHHDADLEGLPQLLQALPRLHTLQLPGTSVKGGGQLVELLGTTQLTSIQLSTVSGLACSFSGWVPCMWSRLELTGMLGWDDVACLPLDSLTQPFVLGTLEVYGRSDHSNEFCTGITSANVRNMTEDCHVTVKIGSLKLDMLHIPAALEQRSSPPTASAIAQQHEKLQLLVNVLKVLHCFERVTVYGMLEASVEDVVVVAPLFQSCTKLYFDQCGLSPSLEFWRQLVQLMPTVTYVRFTDCTGVDTEAMCESLVLMAEQPWARWLDIIIHITTYCYQLPECCSSRSTAGLTTTLPALRCSECAFVCLTSALTTLHIPLAHVPCAHVWCA
ncbi:hypothetical protein V8C86DRAFT_94409 [Haematococcus lacustris]